MVNVCFSLSAVIRSRILVKSLDKTADMARKVRDRELGDRASRAKLKRRGKPYWRTLDQGVHIGYRKNPKPAKPEPYRIRCPPETPGAGGEVEAAADGPLSRAPFRRALVL